jgi:hypothetical protein
VSGLPRPKTPGPWRWKHWPSLSWDGGGEWWLTNKDHPRDDGPRLGVYARAVSVGPDAAAVAALPEWIAEADRLRAEVERLRDFARDAKPVLEWVEKSIPFSEPWDVREAARKALAALERTEERT